jgi:KICSTOR complex C12orf66 like
MPPKNANPLTGGQLPQEEALGAAVVRLLHTRLPRYCRHLSRAKHAAAALVVSPDHGQGRATLGFWDNLCSPLLLLVGCEQLYTKMTYLRAGDEAGAPALFHMYAQVTLIVTIHTRRSKSTLLKHERIAAFMQVASDLETVRRLIAESVAAKPAPAPAAAAVTSKPANTSHQQNNKKKKGRRSTKEAAVAAAAAALAAASSDSTAAAAAQLAAEAASTCTALEQLVAFTQVRVCAADAYRCMAAPAAAVQDHAATAAAAAALRRRAAGLLSHPALASLSAAVKHELACVELLARAQQALARAAFYPAGKRAHMLNCTLLSSYR